MKTDGDNGFQDEENRFDFYRALEAFLAKHLSGRSATDASVLKALERSP